jgi:large repetitive protein
MIFAHRLLFPLLIGLLASAVSFGQSSPKQCLFTISIKDVRADVNEDGGTDEFGWRISANTLNITSLTECVAIDGERNWFTGINRPLLTNRVVNVDETITLRLEGWEDDGCGPRCGYNTCAWPAEDDDNQQFGTATIVLKDYAPGISNTYQLNTAGGGYAVRFEFSYTPPVPQTPTITRGSTQLGPACPTETISLSTENHIRADYQASVIMTWEYSIPKYIYSEGWIDNPAYCGNDGFSCTDPGDFIGWTPPACCSEPPLIWGTIPQFVGVDWTVINTSNGSASLPVLLSNLNLGVLDAPMFVNFRVRSRAGGKTGNYSPMVQLDVSPLAPTIGSIDLIASCKNSPTGEIKLTGVTGTTNKYRVIDVWLDDPLYDPSKPEENFGPTKHFSGSSVTFTDVPRGNHRIVIANADSPGCKNERNIFVARHPDLSLTSLVAQQVSCANGSNGIISVATSGGKPSTQIDFTISPSPAGVIFSRTNQNSGQFLNLPAGSYTITATDNCMDAITSGPSPIIVNQPTQVTATHTKQDPNCLNPNNGVLAVSNVQRGSGTYNYYLYQGAAVVTSNLNTSATAWNLTNLATGTYQIDIRDAARPSCDGYTANFTLAPVTPVSMTLSSKVNVRCFNEDNGTITLSAIGGSGSYLYSLLNTTLNESRGPQTSGTFPMLKPGYYTATVKNNNGCFDTFSISNIEITEPQDISFDIETKRITCFEADNGELTAKTVAGGNGGFAYQWQYLDAATWKNYPLAGGNTQKISNLIPGTYRLTVTDSETCPKNSAAFVIDDPPPLSITSAAPIHVTCKGAADGTIAMAAQGGWGGYVYQYSSNGTTYFDLTAATKLAAGDYQVRVKDAEGCAVDFPSVVEITESSVALSASFSTSNYNGYKVRCSNSNDGTALINATGGNGSPFPSGVYTYSIDGGSFATGNSFTNISAGNHTFRVKDGRGCIYTEVVNFNAPDLLDIQLVNKNYIKCFGDTNGFIEAVAKDGVPPYQFKIGSGAYGVANRFDNLASGAYQIMVRDKNGCEAILNESIDSPNPPIVINLSKEDVSCFGLTDGKITASISGGFPAYTYEWVGRTETGNIIQGLAPGTYTLKITDQESCTQSKSISISQPSAPLSATTTATPIRCFGETNGAIEITPSGGTSPYQYSIDNGLTYQSTNKFFNLSKGTYDVSVKDNRGCTFFSSANIIEPPLFSPSLTGSQNIKCFGENTGSLSVVGVGGAAPYLYSLDGVAYQSSGVFSNLLAGNYQIRVKDDYGCIRLVNVPLTQPIAPLAVTYSMTPVQCKGNADGKIETAVTGGSLPYSYSWQGLSETTSTIEGLAAKMYHLTITDAQGCQLLQSIEVTEPAIALKTTIVDKTDITCHGFANGSFRLDAIGGYPPYQYSFDGGAFNSTNVYSNLTPAIYSLNVRDSRGCLVFASAEIKEPLPLTGTAVSIKNVSCFNGSNAEFEVDARGGTPPYSYSKDGGLSFQSTPLFVTLKKDVYPVWLKDANACTFSFNVTITEPTLLQSSISNVVNSACGQPNGSAQAIPTGGTAPYRYSWKNSAGVEVSSIQQPTNLFAGFYTLTITDANGCTNTPTQIINDENAPAAVISNSVNATCFDSSDGSATVSATGGAGSYTYVWSDAKSQVLATVSNLTRGDYFVTVTDARGCKALASVTITSPTVIQYKIIQQKLPLCNESCDGELELTGVGGVAPYTYAWLTGESAVGGKATALCKGLHQLKITDAANCFAVFNLVVDAPAKLEAQVSAIKQATCAESCDASISITPSGGTAPYQFLWSDSRKQTTAQASNLCIGSYTVTITDAQNCSVTKTILLDKIEPIKINLGKATTLCYEQTLSLDAGIANATYTWTKDKNLFSDKKIVVVKDAGDYELKVTDSRGCSGTGSISVKTSSRSFDANFLGASGLVVGDTLKLTEICFPRADSLQWTFDKRLKVVNPSQEQPELLASDPGDYEIVLSGRYAECSDVARKIITYYKPEDRDKIKDKTPLGLYGIKSVTAQPNPTSGLVAVDVELHQTQLVAAFLYSLDGRELARGKDQEKMRYRFEFDLTNNLPGVYVVMIKTDTQSRTIRIILAK